MCGVHVVGGVVQACVCVVGAHQRCGDNWNSFFAELLYFPCGLALRQPARTNLPRPPSDRARRDRNRPGTAHTTASTMLALVTPALLLPVAQLSQTDTLSSPPVDVPNQPDDSGDAAQTTSATTEGTEGSTGSMGGVGCVVLPPFVDKAPAWWFNAAALLWKLIPYFLIGLCVFVGCCWVCCCMRRFCCMGPVPLRGYREGYGRSRHRRHDHGYMPDPYGHRSTHHRAHAHRHPSWTSSFMYGLSRGVLWSDRRRGTGIEHHGVGRRQRDAGGHQGGHALAEPKGGGLPPEMAPPHGGMEVSSSRAQHDLSA